MPRPLLVVFFFCVISAHRSWFSKKVFVALPQHQCILLKPLFCCMHLKDAYTKKALSFTERVKRNYCCTWLFSSIATEVYTFGQRARQNLVHQALACVPAGPRTRAVSVAYGGTAGAPPRRTAVSIWLRSEWRWHRSLDLMVFRSIVRCYVSGSTTQYKQFSAEIMNSS